MPSSHRTASFLYLLSPRELMRMAGSFPRFPHLLIVSGDTRKMLATSLTVNRSGSFSIERFLFAERSPFIVPKYVKPNYTVTNYNKLVNSNRGYKKSI